MLKKSYRILDIFAQNPTRSYLFSEVKEHITSRSESYTYNNLTTFVKKGILLKEQKGNIRLYKIAKTPCAISFLSMATEHKAWNNESIPTKSIHEIVDKININFFTLLVVGSYAKGKQTENSDLDIIILVPKDTKKITSRLRHFCEMNIPKIHLYVFTDNEFMQMLLDKHHNYGKEAVKENVIFFGAEAYYNILFEAMKNGFTY